MNYKLFVQKMVPLTQDEKKEWDERKRGGRNFDSYDALNNPNIGFGGTKIVGMLDVVIDDAEWEIIKKAVIAAKR